MTSDVMLEEAGAAKCKLCETESFLTTMHDPRIYRCNLRTGLHLVEHWSDCDVRCREPTKISERCMSAQRSFFQFRDSCLASNSQFVTLRKASSIFKVNERGDVWEKIDSWEACLRMPGCTNPCTLGSSDCTCHLRELWNQGIVKLRNHDMSELNETWDKYKCSTRHDQSGHVDHFENNKIIEVAESYEEDKEGDDVLVCVTGQWSRLELKSKTKNLFSVMQSQGVKNLTIAFLLYVVVFECEARESQSHYSITRNKALECILKYEYSNTGTKILSILQNPIIFTHLYHHRGRIERV